MKRRKRMTLSTKPLARRTPMKCDKPLVNQAPLKRTGPVKPRNNKRATAKRVRNFGEPGGEADIVRNMECACASRLRDDWMLGKADPDMACDGPVDPAHAVARGGGGVKGDRWRILALCRKHHEEAGEADRPGQVGETKRSRFIKRYGFDPIVVADDIAVGHPRPLGIRGLADRWAWWATKRCEAARDGECFAADCEGKAVPGWERSACSLSGLPDDGADAPNRLDDHETDALHGWTRREADRETERRRAVRLDASERGRAIGPCDPSMPDAALWPDVVLAMIQDQQSRAGMKPWDVHDDDHPDALADHIATRLGGVFDQGDRSLARALLDAAVQR